MAKYYIFENRYTIYTGIHDGEDFLWKIIRNTKQ